MQVEPAEPPAAEDVGDRLARAAAGDGGAADGELRLAERAMKILRARLYEAERERAQREASEARLAQIGTGERSEKIRTYNYPQNRVTDHRIGFTVHRLDTVLAGDLREFTDALQAEDRRRKLAAAAA